MPQVELEYWCMRVMAYLGGLMLLIALWGGWLLWRKKLEQAKWFQRTAMGAIVVPFLACFGGWILTETGRQPWIVYGLQKTADAVSPSSTTTKVAFSLGVFLALYTGACDRRLLSDAPLRAARSARDRRRRGRSGARRRRPATDADRLVLDSLRALVAVLRDRGLRLRRRHAPADPRPQRGRPANDDRSRSGRSGTATRSGS